MSILTLVRHGQASYMEADYDKLSLRGEEQARLLGRYWARHRITFSRVFHGPARRHRHTMELAAQEVVNAGLPFPEPELVPAFDEFDAYTMMKVMLPILDGRDAEVRRLNTEFRAQQHSPEAGRLLQKLFEEVARHWSTGEFETSGVETWAEFRARVRNAVDHLRRSAEPSTSTVVFTSGGPIAATLGNVLGLSAERAVEFVWLSRNASYSQFLFSGQRFSLHAFNSIPHLDSLDLFTYR